MRETGDTITIRPASSTDRLALKRLAGRDSKLLPHDEFLIAEVADEPWAALGVNTGIVIADPFRPSGEVAALLRIRAGLAPAQKSRPVPPPPRGLLARRAVA